MVGVTLGQVNESDGFAGAQEDSCCKIASLTMSAVSSSF
jgi:hypothetical protein